jgi:hypothetical protein
MQAWHKHPTVNVPLSAFDAYCGNVGSRLVWGYCIVSSFPKIILTQCNCWGGTLLCQGFFSIFSVFFSICSSCFSAFLVFFQHFFFSMFNFFIFSAFLKSINYWINWLTFVCCGGPLLCPAVVWRNIFLRLWPISKIDLQ